MGEVIILIIEFHLALINQFPASRFVRGLRSSHTHEGAVCLISRYARFLYSKPFFNLRRRG